MVNIAERNKNEHDHQHAHRKRKETEKTFDTESYSKLLTETHNLLKKLEKKIHLHEDNFAKINLELENRISNDEIEVIFDKVEYLNDEYLIVKSTLYNLVCSNLALLGCVYHDQYGLEKLVSLCHKSCDA